MNHEPGQRNYKVIIPAAVLLVILLVVGGIAIGNAKKSKQGPVHYGQDLNKPEPGQPQNVIPSAKSSSQSAALEKPTRDTTYPGIVQSHMKYGDSTSMDPMQRGLALANGVCDGQGSKKLGSPPMHPSDVSIIVPYGLLAGGHVTPVDHQYYWGKVQMGDPDMYDVLAPSDGKIVMIQYRSHGAQNSKIKGDYRVVISYSCTFFSYFDLATSLSADIQKLLPPDWEHQQNPNLYTDIDVKQGQVVAKMGGQSLDYAVWDTTKHLKNLTVTEAYDVAEPWKIVTVPPLDYYTDAVKQQVLPLYGRTVEPRDGVIDQDIDGKFIGSWFQEGTYGYAGSAQFQGGDYAKGHLALVRNLYDPNSLMFSIGKSGGNGGDQYLVKNPSPTYDKADASSGLVKYELTQLQYLDDDGKSWVGGYPVKNLKVTSGQTMGTALVQMLEPRKLKVEVFAGKTPAQVSGFTSAAKIYTRGEDAKNAPAIANPNAPTSTAH